MDRLTVNMHALFNPKSVAVIGASDNMSKLGFHVMKSLTNVNKSFWLTLSKIHNHPENERKLLDNAIRNTTVDAVKQVKSMVDLTKMVMVKVK